MIQQLFRRLAAPVCPQCNNLLQPDGVDRFAMRLLCPTCGYRKYAPFGNDWLS